MRFPPGERRGLIALLALSLALVLLLTYRLHQLGAEYQRVRRLAPTLHDGSYVPPVRVALLNGDSVTLGELGEGTRRQVLFFFTTTCPYCRATVPVWRDLADSLARAGARVQVLGVSLDSAAATRSYQAAQRLTFPVVLLPSRRYAVLYKALAVPQTVVLDAEGRVRYGTIGPLRRSAVLDSVYHAALDPDPPRAIVAAGPNTTPRSDR
jgi:peroxiredoxin